MHQASSQFRLAFIWEVGSLCTFLPVGLCFVMLILILDYSIMGFSTIYFPIESTWISFEGTTLIHTYCDFDQCLGTAENRYFGEGYLRVTRAVSGIELNQDEKKFWGIGHIEHSGSWSKKGDEEQEAHLSSVDAILLAWHLCEAFIEAEFSLSALEMSNAWVCEISVRAGSQPLTALSAFGISGALVSVNDDATNSGSTYRCTIGPLVVDMTVRHPTGNRHSTTVQPSGMTKSLTQRRECPTPLPTPVRLTQVVVDTEKATSAATFQVDALHNRTEEGLEAAYSSGISIVDAVVLVAQLAQTYLYTMDNLDRADSNTLWMRRIQISIATPVRAPQGEVTVTINAANPKTLDMRSAGVWRLSDFELHDYCGISGKTSVAHQLVSAESGVTS